MYAIRSYYEEGSNNGNAVSSDVAATGLSSPLSLAWGTLMHPANSGGIDVITSYSIHYTKLYDSYL